MDPKMSNDPAEMTELQLRQELRLMGVEAGPIISSTRGVYEKKLLRLRSGTPADGGDEGEDAAGEDVADEGGEDGAKKRLRTSSLPSDKLNEAFCMESGSAKKSGIDGGGVEKQVQRATSSSRMTVDYSSPPEDQDYEHEEFSRDITPKSHQKRISSRLPSASARRPLGVTVDTDGVEKGSWLHKVLGKLVANKWTIAAFTALVVLLILLLLYVFVPFLRWG